MQQKADKFKPKMAFFYLRVVSLRKPGGREKGTEQVFFFFLDTDSFLCLSFCWWVGKLGGGGKEETLLERNVTGKLQETGMNWLVAATYTYVSLQSPKSLLLQLQTLKLKLKAGFG